MKGNPAILVGSVAFRPRLATGLAKQIKADKEKARCEAKFAAGFPVPHRGGKVPADFQLHHGLSGTPWGGKVPITIRKNPN